MGMIEDEMADVATEMDGMLSDLVWLIDSDGRRIPVTGSVGQFFTGRELNARGNITAVRSAHVVLLKKTNFDLAEILSALKTQAIPNGWQCEIDRTAYRVANASSDGVAFEFDIQQGIS